MSSTRTIDITVQCAIAPSFRVAQVAGLFDLPPAGSSSERFTVELPALDDPWAIGAIVGPSGSGKSTIARHAFGPDLVEGFDWPADRAIVDGFPADLPVQQITSVLSAVGLASPPAWLRPCHVLSRGQQFRCDLARSLLLGRELVVFDEFTSVVNRTVAQVSSACVARVVRQQRARCRRFVAVTCHHDVLDWLEPDWVLDMAGSVLARGRLRQRPALILDITSTHRRAWQLFRKHHYLSSDLHPSARCYLGSICSEPAAFCATLPALGQRNRRRVTRLVVLPDYQGISVGSRMLNAIAEHEGQTSRLGIRTSHPGLLRTLDRDPHWRRTSLSRGHQALHRGSAVAGRRAGSHGRITLSFDWHGT